MRQFEIPPKLRSGSGTSIHQKQELLVSDKPTSAIRCGNGSGGGACLPLGGDNCSHPDSPGARSCDSHYALIGDLDVSLRGIETLNVRIFWMILSRVPEAIANNLQNRVEIARNMLESIQTKRPRIPRNKNHNNQLSNGSAPVARVRF